MSKRTVIKPHWLDRLLWQWAHRTTDENGLGFYSVNPMLKAGIPMPARAYEPMGYNAEDFEATTLAVSELPHHYRLVILRAYKPWAAKALEQELGSFSQSERTWQRWVHEAAELLHSRLKREQGRVIVLAEMT